MTFENLKPTNPQQLQVARQVHISQVVTEQELVTRSGQLESALVNNQLNQFCTFKVENCRTPLEKSVWNFLQVYHETYCLHNK